MRGETKTNVFQDLDLFYPLDEIKLQAFCSSDAESHLILPGIHCLIHMFIFHYYSFSVTGIRAIWILCLDSQQLLTIFFISCVRKKIYQAYMSMTLFERFWFQLQISRFSWNDFKKEELYKGKGTDLKMAMPTSGLGIFSIL